MTLVELQDILGRRIEITLREDLTPEDRQIANEQSQLVVGIALHKVHHKVLLRSIETAVVEHGSFPRYFVLCQNGSMSEVCIRIRPRRAGQQRESQPVVVG